MTACVFQMAHNELSLLMKCSSFVHMCVSLKVHKMYICDRPQLYKRRTFLP